MISSTVNWTDLNHFGDELLSMLWEELTGVGRSPDVGATVPYWDPGLGVEKGSERHHAFRALTVSQVQT